MAETVDSIHLSIWLSILFGDACKSVVAEFEKLFEQIAVKDGALLPVYAEAYRTACSGLTPYAFYSSRFLRHEVESVPWEYLKTLARHVSNGFMDWELGVTHMLRIMKVMLLYCDDPRANRLVHVLLPTLEKATSEMKPFFCTISGYGYRGRQMTVTDIMRPSFVRSGGSSLSAIPVLRLLVDLITPLTAFIDFAEFHSNYYASYYSDHEYMIPTTLEHFLYTNQVLHKHFWTPLFVTHRHVFMPVVQADIEARLAPGRDLNIDEIERFKFYEANGLAMFVDRGAVDDFYVGRPPRAAHDMYGGMVRYNIEDNNAARWWA